MEYLTPDLHQNSFQGMLKVRSCSGEADFAAHSLSRGGLCNFTEYNTTGSPSPSPGSYSDSCPLSLWCHPTILSSVVPFSSCLLSVSASGAFPMSQFFTSMWPKYWSFSIGPSNEYSGLISFRMGWLDLLAVQGILKSLLQHHSWKASILNAQFYHPTLTSIHDYWKNHSLDYMDIYQQTNVSAF